METHIVLTLYSLSLETWLRLVSALVEKYSGQAPSLEPRIDQSTGVHKVILTVPNFQEGKDHTFFEELVRLSLINNWVVRH